MSHTLRYFIIIFGLLVIVTSCKKWSKKWLVAEVEVVDSSTNEPLEGVSVYLQYSQNNVGQNSEEEELLGFTNEDGIVYVERRISRRDLGFKIGIYVAGAYPSVYFKGKSVNPRGKNYVKLSN